MRRFSFFLTVAFAATAMVDIANAKLPLPIIDMHLHAMLLKDAEPPGEHFCMEYLAHSPTIDPVREPMLETLEVWRRNPDCPVVIAPPETDDELLTGLVDILREKNVIGVVSGPRELVQKWRAADPDRIIPARGFNLNWDSEISPDELAVEFAAGEFEVFGEVSNQYFGFAPNAKEFDAYWKMAAENDIPVGIHIGYMPPAAAYWGIGARISLADPMLLEDVLIRYPKLRVYIMHAGYPQIERTVALMQQYPQVYADTGILQALLSRPAYDRFLKRMFDAGLGKRLMYGTDQIIWPQSVRYSLEVVEDSKAISSEQKRDLLFNNAARFLRLTDDEINRRLGR